MFTGLDVSNNSHHNAIYNGFVNNARDKAPSVIYRILTADHELITRKSSEKSPTLLKSVRGILKRNWPDKYLVERPALVVCFVDLDWDTASWMEKKTECESKINSLRQSIGQREIRLALVLVQSHVSTSPNGKSSAERGSELCSQCKLSSKHLFIFPPMLNEQATAECESYLVLLKKIRARSVPNNDLTLLVRQQFKLAFLSELRQDTHSALRYYKQAYQHIAEIEFADSEAYEILAVAGLLNYKVCELSFLHNSAFDAVAQFRRHQKLFFQRESGAYPSRELATIETVLWKSQQCRLFAELFEKAVSKQGLAAYPFQNPGRFLEESAAYFKSANFLIRQLRSKLGLTQSTTRMSPMDPLQSFDTNPNNTVYYGQRPWRSKLDPSISAGLTDQLTEHSAKVFLEKSIKENYQRSLQLLSMAVQQFKRYSCEGMQHLAMVNMADDYVNLHEFPKALQLLHHVSSELRARNFRQLLQFVLLKYLNVAYCMVNLSDYVWALVQLLSPNNNNSPAIEQCAKKFMENRFSVPPLPVLDLMDGQNSDLICKADIDLAQTQWDQYYNHSLQVSFSVEMSKLQSFVQCKARFLCAENAFAGDPLTLEVHLINFSKFLWSLTNPSTESTKLYFIIHPTLDGPNQREKTISIRKVALRISSENTKANASFDWDMDQCNARSARGRSPAFSDQTNLAVRVVCQQRKGILVTCAASTEHNKISLLVDEPLDVPFVLDNQEKQSLKNVRVICQQIYKEDDQVTEGTTLVPVFNQELLALLDPGQNFSFPVRLSTKSVNCVGLQVQITCLVENSNGCQDFVECHQVFEVVCQEAFSSSTNVFALNEESIAVLVQDQSAIIEAIIQSTTETPLQILSLRWNLNLSSNQLDENLQHKEAENSEMHEKVVLTKGGQMKPRTKTQIPSLINAAEFSLGDLIVEWKRCQEPSETVRTIVNLGQWPVVAVPLAVSASMQDDLAIVFSFQSTCSKVMPLRVELERSDVFVFSGYKEFSIHLLPNEVHAVEVTMIALSVGQLPFPKLNVQVLSAGVVDASTQEQMNTLIQLHAFKSLPTTLFVFP
uniref:Trafficking protein particle complex subunit 11 n=1 Tax=Ditylenchus dipsaci TaxID=166011 RepID=A0A915DQJ1_9BILA